MDNTGVWIPSPPAPIVPVPAAQATALRGRRVIIGSGQSGWRYDLRADDPVDQNGQRLVPVLGEYDYYRAELDHIEVFAPLVPIDQVWVEHTDTEAITPDDGPSDLLARLVSLDAPPARHPVPAHDMPTLTGRRVVLVAPARNSRNVRVVSEPYEAADHTISLRICKEAAWYRWAFTGTPPHSVETPIYLIWVE